MNHMLVADLYIDSLLTRVELGLYPMLGGGLSSVEDSEDVGLDCGVDRDVPCELVQMAQYDAPPNNLHMTIQRRCGSDTMGISFGVVMTSGVSTPAHNQTLHRRLRVRP